MRWSSTWHQQPVVEVEHDGRMVLAVGALARPGIAWAVLGGDGAHTQGADIVATRQGCLLQYLRPGIDGVAAEGRRDMAAAVDGGDAKAVGEAVEGQCAGERDHVAAISQPAAKARVLAGIGVEMHPRGVLVE